MLVLIYLNIINMIKDKIILDYLDIKKLFKLIGKCGLFFL